MYAGERVLSLFCKENSQQIFILFHVTFSFSFVGDLVFMIVVIISQQMLPSAAPRGVHYDVGPLSVRSVP